MPSNPARNFAVVQNRDDKTSPPELQISPKAGRILHSEAIYRQQTGSERLMSGKTVSAR